MTKGWDRSWKQNILKGIPLGRFGTSGDVTNAIIFLASEKSSFMTGAIIDLNSGMYSGQNKMMHASDFFIAELFLNFIKDL